MDANRPALFYLMIDPSWNYRLAEWNLKDTPLVLQPPAETVVTAALELRAPEKPAPAPLAFDAACETAPDAALAAISAYPGPILVDLDETLYLRNSTEDFIDSARPGLLAILIMRILQGIKPWRFTGGEVTRDAWRVRSMYALLPWVAWSWQRRVSQLAAAFVNQPLLAAIRARSVRPIIVTAGFRPIVTPLIEAMGLGPVEIIAVRGFGLADRRRGKLSMAVEALGSETVANSLVITDSPQDEALLRASARPLRTVWPEAAYHPALARVYLPGEYLARVKRPGERYLVRGILQEDFAFWVLSSAALAVSPWTHVAGLLLLLLSFWCIYERGYVDNDRMGLMFETKPKLSREFHVAPVATPRWWPWLWAIGAGAAAIAVLRAPARPEPLDFAKWFAVLLATHFWFKLYNRVDKTTRIWMFPLLQWARSAAFIVLVPVAAIGGAALGAHIVARWVPYYVYRLGGQEWPKEHVYLTRLLFFILLALLLLASVGPSAVFNATGFALLLWNIFRARREITVAVRGVSRLDRPGAPP